MGGGFTGTQTDSRPAVPSCADPSLSGWESLLPPLYHWPPASPRITQRRQNDQGEQSQPLRLPVPSLPPHPRPAAHRAHLVTRVCCRYQQRSAQRPEPSSWYSSHRTGLPPQRSHLHGCTMATFVCRVQFLDDTDPFNSTNFPEPTRPPLYTFREDIPLINQLAGVHRLLKAPHKVSPRLNLPSLMKIYLYRNLQ